MMFKQYCKCGRYRAEIERGNARVLDLDDWANVVACVRDDDLVAWLERYDPGCEWKGAEE